VTLGIGELFTTTVGIALIFAALTLLLRLVDPLGGRRRSRGVRKLLGTEIRGEAKLQGLADEDLMDLVAAADPEAFGVILERHGDVAFSLAYRMCGSRAISEDVTQEAFLALWRMAGRYDHTRGSVRSWTLRIVRNRAIDTLRANGRHRSHTAGDVDPDHLDLSTGGDAASQALGSIEAQTLRDALAELPDLQRQAIELAYFGGFTQTEIAEMLHKPLGTVKGRMRLGLHKLRDRCRELEMSPR
jgi:RNA polymerase sigma-70 factor, ECF subfamily